MICFSPILTVTKFLGDLYMHGYVHARRICDPIRCRYKALCTILLPLLIFRGSCNICRNVFSRYKYINTISCRFINFHDLGQPSGSTLMVIFRYAVIHNHRDHIFMAKLFEKLYSQVG